MTDWWVDYPWRSIQTNFTQIDTRNFDEDAFVAFCKDFNCNAVMLNAAGILASYPSSVEDHLVSEHLDGFSLKRLVTRLQAQGIRCIARTDFSKCISPFIQSTPIGPTSMKTATL